MTLYRFYFIIQRRIRSLLSALRLQSIIVWSNNVSMPQSNSRSHKYILYTFIWLRRLKWNEHWTESSHRCFDDDDSVVASAVTKMVKVYQLKSISMMIFVHFGSFHSPSAALQTQQSPRLSESMLLAKNSTKTLSTDAYRCVRWAESSEWKQTIENVINVSRSLVKQQWICGILRCLSVRYDSMCISGVVMFDVRRERSKTCT